MDIVTSNHDFKGSHDLWETYGVNMTHEVNNGIVKFETHGNHTVFAQYPKGLLEFAAACCIVFAIVGVIGNFISILALSKSKRLRNATTAFIVNLGAADLLFCSFSLPLSAVTFLEGDWNYGEFLCKLYPLIRYSNGAVSIFSVIAITINRYILIVYPKIYNEMYRPRNVGIMIGFIWLSGLMLLMLPLTEVWGRFGYDPKVGTCSILKLNDKSPKMFLYAAAFGLPSVIFIVCYTRIFFVVHRSAKKLQTHARKSSCAPVSVTFTGRKSIFRKTYRHSEMTNDHPHSELDQRELKVLRVILVLFISFVLCYFPVSFVKIFRKENDLPYLNILGYLGIYFSNIINPVIYVVMSDEYRTAYKELFQRNTRKNLSTSSDQSAV